MEPDRVGRREREQERNELSMEEWEDDLALEREQRDGLSMERECDEPVGAGPGRRTGYGAGVR